LDLHLKEYERKVPEGNQEIGYLPVMILGQRFKGGAHMFGIRFFIKIFMTSISFFSICFPLLFPLITYAAQVTLAWDPVMDPNVVGYRVYYGTSSRSYQFNNDAGRNTTITVSNLQDGTTYYFAVTSYGTAGLESGYSNEVSYGAPTTCLSVISPVSQSVGYSGGTGTVSVSSQSGCNWTAVSNASSWIIITSNNSGTGNGTVNYSVDPNSATTSRSGTMTIAGNAFTVNQGGVRCAYTISPTSQSFNSNGGTGTFSVTGTTGCSWKASANARWLKITSGSRGSGNGNVNFSVSPNTGRSSRTGTVTIAGETFKVTQSGRR
jgi:hypothetical protein